VLNDKKKDKLPTISYSILSAEIQVQFNPYKPPKYPRSWNILCTPATSLQNIHQLKTGICLNHCQQPMKILFSAKSNKHLLKTELISEEKKKKKRKEFQPNACLIFLFFF